MEDPCCHNQDRRVGLVNGETFVDKGRTNSYCLFGKSYTLGDARDVLLNGSVDEETIFQAISDSSITERKVAKILFHLSNEKACAQALAAWQGMPLLIRLLRSPRDATKMQSCITLGRVAKFATEEDLKQSVPLLVELLTSYTTCHDLAECAAFALRRLAKVGEDLSVEIGTLGAVPLLLDISSSSDGSLQLAALKALSELVLYTQMNLGLLAQSGGLPAIVNLVVSGSSEVKCLAAEILGALTSLREMRRALVHMSGISALIEAARVGCNASRARAAHALGLLAFTKRLRRTIVNAGGVPVLVDLLNSGDHMAKLIAGNTLGILSAHANHLRHVAEAGAIPLFVNLLEGNDPLGKEIAEDGFCILAVLEENAIAIAEHLVRILENGTVEAKAAAADVIWDLSSYKHSVPVVTGSGAMPLLARLLRDENEEVRERISGAVAQLSYNDSDKQAMAESGIISVLVELLHDPSDDVKENIAEALHNFAEDTFYRLDMSEASAAPALLELQNSLSAGSRARETGNHVTAALHYLGQLT
eukprot:c27503_g1_i2 orf=709-2310(-)